MEESNKVTVACLSTFDHLDRLLQRQGLTWGQTSKQPAILETLKRLGSYSAQRVLKRLVQLGEFKWDEENDFEVEAILDYSKEFTDFEEVVELYLIKWKGWTNVHNTWEPKEHLDCANLLEEFHKLRDSDASRSQILARMSELTRTPETLSMLEKLRAVSFKLADKDILPEKLMQIARQTSKRRVEVMNSQTAKRHKNNEGMVNITNKRTKAYKVLKAEMDLVLKQWEAQMNKVDVNQAPIAVENKVDLDGPPDNFIYTNDYIEGKDIVIPQDPLVGCDCVSCLDEKKSCCGPNAGSEFAYYKNKRVRVKAGTPIYECNKYCKCPKECPNRVVQFGRQHKVCLFKTANGRGWGVKAMQKIKKGSFVVEYVGEVITHEEAERRGKIYDGAGRTYLFDLDYNDDDCPYTVDAGNYGNISHFINHSCDPNLVVYGVWINTLDPRLPRIALFSQRDIEKGEELTFDYMMTADTPGGFGVRAQEAKRLEISMNEDGASDVVSDTTSEGTEMDPTKESVLEKLSEVEDDVNTMKPPPVSTEVPVITEALTPLSIDQPLVDAVPSVDVAMSADSGGLTPVGADLSALEVKAEVSAVEDMPPTPPPSEIQDASPRLKKSPELSPFKRFRVVCQCGAKNCRGFLY